MRSALLLCLLPVAAWSAPQPPKNCTDLAAPIVGKPYHLARSVLIMAGHRPKFPALKAATKSGPLVVAYRFDNPEMSAELFPPRLTDSRIMDALSIGYLETIGQSTQGAAARSFAWHGFTIHATGCEDMARPDTANLCTVRTVTCQ